MIIIQKKQKRKIGNFKADDWEFRNVKKAFSHKGHRGAPSTYKYTANAYWKKSGKFAGYFIMNAKNLKDLKENIKLEDDTVHLQLRRSKERMAKLRGKK